ncbi:hypothetical protein ACP4OV_020069 [Aristida adscensionis]
MPRKSKTPAPAPGSPMRTRSMAAAAGKRATEAAPAKEEEEVAAVEQKGRKRGPKKEEAAAVEPKGRKKAKKDAEAPAAEENGGDAVEEGKGATEAAPAEKVEEAAVEQKGKKRGPKKKEAEAAAEPKGRKKVKKDAEAPAAEENGGVAAAEGKRVIVEACTQCKHFKMRAQKVKEDLESSVPGVSVIINPEKPRRGCLEIREEGGEVFISLLNMPRPFTAMKKLDMDEVIKDIAKKIS